MIQLFSAVIPLIFNARLDSTGFVISFHQVHESQRFDQIFKFATLCIFLLRLMSGSEDPLHVSFGCI